jgi:hypothetical protein
MHVFTHAIQKWISISKNNETGKQIGPLYIVVVEVVVYKTNLTGLGEQRLSCNLCRNNTLANFDVYNKHVLSHLSDTAVSHTT